MSEKPLTKKQIKQEQEKQIRAKMGEKAYAQKQISRKTSLIEMYNFVTLFLLIGMGIGTLTFVLFNLIDKKVYNIVCLIICSVLFLASIVFFVLWKTVYVKKLRREIEASRKIIKEITDKENEKQLKIAEHMKRQRKDVI